MDTPWEKKKVLLDAMLVEYAQMKAESINKLQVQITIISIYVSVFGALLSIGITGTEMDTFELPLFGSPVFFCTIVPSVAICIAIIWLDQVYRQIKIAVYISLLEIKINKLLNRPNTLWESVIFWEQWLRNNSSNNLKNCPRNKKRKLSNPNQFFYFICLGIFLVFPVASYCFGFYLANCDICSLVLPTIISFGGYVAAIIFGAIYIRQILLFNKYSTSTTKQFSNIPIDIRPN